MRWAEVTLVTDLDASDAAAEILISEGCGGVAGGDAGHGHPVRQTTSAYFPVDDRLSDILENVKRRAARLRDLGFDGAEPELTVKLVEDQDWATAWKSFFRPLVIGRVVIKPTWEEFAPRPEQLVVELDPGMAFGTGNHPTTKMCLLALQRYLRPGDVMIDVGTGSGILAIAAARLGASKTAGIDIDPIAVKAARENVTANGVESAVGIVEGSSPAALGMRADLVVANIVAEAIMNMRGELRDALEPAGVLITSGIIDDRGEDVEASLKEIGMSTLEVVRDGEWVTIVSRAGSGGHGGTRLSHD